MIKNNLKFMFILVTLIAVPLLAVEPEDPNLQNHGTDGGGVCIECGLTTTSQSNGILPLYRHLSMDPTYIKLSPEDRDLLMKDDTRIRGIMKADMDAANKSTQGLIERAKRDSYQDALEIKNCRIKKHGFSCKTKF